MWVAQGGQRVGPVRIHLYLVCVRTSRIGQLVYQQRAAPTPSWADI